MPRFVLLRHDCPPHYKPSHWDLMLEIGPVLATWELQRLPPVWACLFGGSDSAPESSPILATRLPDHRLAYLEYEGPLTGDRGKVERCASGTYSLQVSDSADRMLIELRGEGLEGVLELFRLEDSPLWRVHTAASPG